MAPLRLRDEEASSLRALVLLQRYSLGLDQVAARALDRNQDTRPVSGRQELLENLLNSYL